MVLRSAQPGEAEALSVLIFESKASNGYDSAFMEACRAELRVREADIAADKYRVAVDADGALLGCGAVRALPEPGLGEIMMMFVAPTAKRRGIGQRLMLALIAKARDLGVKRLELDADPAACAFYMAQGFRTFTTVPSGSIPGRRLERMALSLEPV